MNEGAARQRVSIGLPFPKAWLLFYFLLTKEKILPTFSSFFNLNEKMYYELFYKVNKLH
jgi:hypothetical protein